MISTLLLLLATSMAQDTPIDAPVDAPIDAQDAPVDAAPIDEDIRDIKPAVDIDTSTALWPWALGGAGLLALGGTALWAWKRRSKPLDPVAQLRAALGEAESIGDSALRADAITAAMRRFIAQVTPVQALHLTTDELTSALTELLSEPVLTEFSALFHRCDTVRFAGLREVEAATVPWLDDFIADLTTPAEDESDSPTDDIAAK